MTLVFDESEPQPVPVPITLPDGTAFKLFLRRLVLDDRLIDHVDGIDISLGDTKAVRQRFLHRIDSIVGWEDVLNAAGEPIEFTQDRLRKLLGRRPELIAAIAPAVSKLFDGGEPVAHVDGEPSTDDQEPAQAQHQLAESI